MISVIVPTYNERVNIQLLCEKIHSSLSGHNYELVIVDDDSPDGTGEIAKSLAKKYPIKVIQRKNEKGLSSAVLRGFREANGSSFIVMDADLSHPPEVLPQIVEELKTHDLVVGSRYVKGGYSRDTFLRRGISIFACILACPLTSTRDSVTGFFGIRRSCLEGVTLNPIGYKIGLECFARAKITNYKEIPIEFVPRKKGESKFSLFTVKDYVKQLFSLYIYKLRRVIKFGVAEVAGTLLILLGTFILTEFAKLYYMLSLVVATVIGFLAKYHLNAAWTFFTTKSATDADYDWHAWYKGNPIQKRWKKSISRKTYELAGNPKMVLDLGCGSSPTINQFNCKCIGIDNNPAKIEFMRRHSPHQFLCMDILKIEHQEEFDTIICNEVLEHLPKEEGEILVKKISKALARGGRAIVATPDYSSFLWRSIQWIYGLLSPQAYAGEHISPYTKDKVIHLFRKHGLYEIKVETVFGCDLVICFEKK